MPPQIAEVGHQKLLLEDLPAAAFHFDAAQHLDPLSVQAAVGLAECTILQGRFDEADQQLQVSFWSRLGPGCFGFLVGGRA